MNNKKYESEKADDMTEEELLESFEPILDFFREYIKHDEGRVYIINPERAEQVVEVYRALKQITKDSEDIEITYNEPGLIKTMCSISLMGKEIEFIKGKWLYEIAKLADGFEINPRTDGKIVMDFTFYGIAKPLFHGKDGYNEQY